MNKFYLIRHGEKKNTKGDPGLTQKGKEKSFRTGIYLKNKNIVKIFSSPFKRTRQTAIFINKGLKVKIQIDDRLKERMNWGSIPNQTLQELLVEWDKATKNRDYVPVGGISSRQAGEYMYGVIREISETSKDLNYVIVAHGGIIMDFVRNITKGNELLNFEKTSPEIKRREASITTVIENKGVIKVKEVGSIDHLI